MEVLLEKLARENDFGRADEANLYREHLRHFTRRVRVLDAAFFPGRDKSDEGIRSLGNGAYGSFRREPCYAGNPAFIHTVVEELPPKQFLYYWRSSATLEFLKREGPGSLKDRLNLLRNVRIHLREGFEQIPTPVGEDLWTFVDRQQGERRRAPNLSNLLVDLRSRRGKAAVEAILEAAGVPLTRSGIAGVMQRCTHTEPHDEVQTEMEAASDAQAPEDALLERDVDERVRSFFSEQLNDEERAVLNARGYAADGRPRRPFREVAERLGRLKAESYRMMERRILELFREKFDDRDEMELAVQALARVLGAETEQDPVKS